MAYVRAGTFTACLSQAPVARLIALREGAVVGMKICRVVVTSREAHMSYDAIGFNELVKKFEDQHYRLAAIQVHDEMYLAIASLTTLFGAESVTVERVIAVVELMSRKHKQLLEQASNG